MKIPGKPESETERIDALHACNVLDTLPEQAYDDIVFLAAQICESPIALMSLVDEERQWFKASIGTEEKQTPREVAFCSYAILQPDDLLIVENALEDERFAENPLVVEDPHIRFYAGAPLVDTQGYALGTLCVIDTIPRTLTPRHERTLKALARQIIAQLELRKNVEELRHANDELARMQQALARSNGDLQQFAYVAAHDLKQPLRMISSFAELLTEELVEKLSAEEKEYLDLIVSNAHRGQELVSDILAFSQLNNQQSSEAVATAEIFNRAMDNYRHDYPAAILECGKLQAIEGDTSQLQQLAQNLIGNALKYNDQPVPRVSVRGELLPDGSYAVSVADNGIGIDTEHRDSIFEMFTRLHDSGSYEGSGVGLAMCQRVMELHGGSIKVDSVTSADASETTDGTVFTCIFPPQSLVKGASDDSRFDIAS